MGCPTYKAYKGYKKLIFFLPKCSCGITLTEGMKSILDESCLIWPSATHKTHCKQYGQQLKLQNVLHICHIIILNMSTHKPSPSRSFASEFLSPLTAAACTGENSVGWPLCPLLPPVLPNPPPPPSNCKREVHHRNNHNIAQQCSGNESVAS